MLFFRLFQADSMVSLSDSSSYLAEKLEENEAKVKIKEYFCKIFWSLCYKKPNNVFCISFDRVKIVANLILVSTVQLSSVNLFHNCAYDFLKKFRPEN